MQLLPQVHLHAQVVVDEEAHLAVGAVKVVVRVVYVVGRHEAVRAHLQQPRRRNKNTESHKQDRQFLPTSFDSWLKRDKNFKKKIKAILRTTALWAAKEETAELYNKHC